MIAVTVYGLPADAAGQPSPRAAVHDGFGRMVFDWPTPVGFSASVVEGALVVHFDKPISGDPKVVVKPLAGYLSGVSLRSVRC